MWPEIHNVLNENRHELILSGTEISQRLNQDGLDANLFKLISLNLLRISDTSLETVPDEVCNLKNLLSLLLHSNKLLKITPKLFDLTKLKVLDLSNNQIAELPDEIAQLSQLTSLNISSNKLEKLPGFQQNSKLSVLDASHNILQEFPDLCHCELVHLAEVKLNANLIANIPHEIKVLAALKVLDLSANKVAIIPGELSECSKLKDVNLKENPVSDKRLLKLIEQCRSKQVLDYVRQNCPRKGTTGQSTGAGKKGKKSKNREHKNSDDYIAEGGTTETDETRAEPVVEQTPGSHQIVVLKTNDEETTLNIQILDAVKAVRPFILACIIKNVKFDETTFRRFIQMQTKLHDTICEKRNAATIATHDLSKISGAGDLSYTACAPSMLKIRPLNRGAICTGAKLFEQLRTEAENLRREKKRNTFSGVHRYLYLLEGRNTYPCLLDADKKVISFPPITNSDDTKISLETDSIFVEVTSASGQDVCKKVLDAVLQETLELGIGGKAPDEKYHQLKIQKVKIVDLDGNLKAVYPSRADLNYETQHGINILRE